MTTTAINGKDAPWSKEISDLFEAKLPELKEGERVSYANYYTARPWKNEYDTGSEHTGFTYTLQPGHRVCFVHWRTQRRQGNGYVPV